MRRPQALAALAHRDFTLLWAGQFVSQLGTQVQTVALAWLVYTLTGSPAQLGGVGLARAIPTILLSLFGGTLADQVDRRRLLLVSETILAALSGALAIGISSGWTSVPLLYAFAAATAAAGAVDNPARQALIPALVPRERLANALTLNVLAWDSAMVLGPAAGGFVLAHFGASVAFWLDAASFFAVVAALVAMRTRPAVPVRTQGGWAALVDGIRFVKERAIIWQLMLMDFLATLFVSSMGLLPVFARDVLRVGEEGLGLLYAAPSAGAVAGSLLFAMLPAPRRPGRMVALAIMGYGLVLAGFGLAPTFWVALVFLALAGGLDAISMALRHVTRQLATPDDFRGRVGAVASVFAAGGPRLGDFQSGLLA
ncbi:MAG: MFS transporter, partial [Thermomicrobiaceae bacterium]|nr:MFS transporter [Thermomicrobiaceae bacterium]